jgi:hypothetical protein
LHCFVVGDLRTQWDKIVPEMHTRDPWISMNGSSNKGPHICWPSFLDCIELHKLTIFPVDATEKQHYYMMQTVKKPQFAKVRQYMARMGILNDCHSFLPMVFNSSMALAGTKKGNVPFDEVDLARIVLNSVPISWMNQYNMTHLTLLDRSRTLLQDLESIKRIMEERCVNIHSWITLSGDLVFSHQQGIYSFNFSKRFFGDLFQRSHFFSLFSILII